MIAGLLVIGALASGAAAQPGTRTVHISVTDKNGAPVTDLQAADLEIKAGGKVQQVLGVKPATAPLRIAVLDADAGTGGFPLSISKFIQELLRHAAISLTSLVNQSEPIVAY